MKNLLIGLTAILVYTCSNLANANSPAKGLKTAVSLESKVESDGISLTLTDNQIGVYHHFILEKSLDSKTYFEVARVDELKAGEGSGKINFKDFPFEKNSISCVFYRIRAVDDFGWFDFTNIVSVLRNQDLAKRKGDNYLVNQLEGRF